MPKRLIICCDGTWQSSDSGEDGIPSNIARFSRILAAQGKTASGADIEQVVYYQTGVGTGAMGKLDRITQGMTGDGLEEHVIQAYHFLATNHCPGDEIFLFGFSRGAYTARALGGLLTSMGLLQPIDLEDFRYLYSYFKEHDDKIVFGEQSEEEQLKHWTKYKGTKPSKKTVPVKVEVTCIGVWDTVGSLGLPESMLTKLTGVNKGRQFYNTALNGSVKNAFHALALDEHRGAFTPTLWYLEEADKDLCNMRQCWFPGYHCDIGGGVKTSAIDPQRRIDTISLAWMCDQVDGLLTFDTEAALLMIPPVNEAAEWSAGITADPCSPLYSLNIAGSSVLRTPGSYNKDLEVEDAEGEKSTRERMHPSIQLRTEVPGLKYYPAALDARKDWSFVETPKWEFVESLDGTGASWRRPKLEGKSGILGGRPMQREINIKEHIIREFPDKMNFEARLLPKFVKERLAARNSKVPAS